MTLAASGAISLGGSTATRSINLELGQSATAQISLNDANVRSLAGVPSGAIVVPTNFYGKSAAPVVNFTNQSVFAANSGAPASAVYSVKSDGFDYSTKNSGSPVALSNWVVPASAGGNYEVFATVDSGALSAGTTGSWLATTGSPAWRCTAATVAAGDVYADLTLQVRAVGTTLVLDTWAVNLLATRIS